jgi:hypothetical protein
MAYNHTGKGLIQNSAYAPQLKELKYRVPSTLTDKEAAELQQKSSKVQQATVQQAKHKKTALTYDEQAQSIKEEAMDKARKMIDEQSDRMRTANQTVTSPELMRYQGDAERKQIYEFVYEQRDAKLEQLKAQFAAEEANAYMWVERKEAPKDKSQEARYRHLFSVVPPNSLGVYKKGREFTKANQDLINELLVSARKIFKDVDESAPGGNNCFCCHRCRRSLRMLEGQAHFRACLRCFVELYCGAKCRQYAEPGHALACSMHPAWECEKFTADKKERAQEEGQQVDSPEYIVEPDTVARLRGKAGQAPEAEQVQEAGRARGDFEEDADEAAPREDDAKWQADCAAAPPAVERNEALELLIQYQAQPAVALALLAEQEMLGEEDRILASIDESLISISDESIITG